MTEPLPVGACDCHVHVYDTMRCRAAVVIDHTGKFLEPVAALYGWA